jgi:hypothetical protein
VVGVEDIRGFAGTLLREGMRGNSGIFVTFSDFSEQARSEARKIGLTLIDRHDLYQRVERVRRPEPCPVCGSTMVLGHSQYGWWFHCQVDGCRGKKNLSNEAGRAVEFLTLAA